MGEGGERGGEVMVKGVRERGGGGGEWEEKGR